LFTVAPLEQAVVPAESALGEERVENGRRSEVFPLFVCRTAPAPARPARGDAGGDAGRGPLVLWLEERRAGSRQTKGATAGCLMSQPVKRVERMETRVRAPGGGRVRTLSQNRTHLFLGTPTPPGSSGRLSAVLGPV
jgi:hypothetical protein